MMSYIKYTAFCLLLWCVGTVTAQENRYQTPIFKDFNLYENLTYAEARPQGSSREQPYRLTFYEPANDPALKRPLILLFPDGNYRTGRKEQLFLVDWCKELTAYGYTCACVDYRQSSDFRQPRAVERALYRGVQDARAAVRYFIENRETFKIDTEQIYLAGKYAGAEVALHTAFINQDAERPRSSFQFGEEADLSCLDCSGNPFSHRINIAGVINIAGNLLDPKLLFGDTLTKVLNFQIDTTQILKAGQAADFDNNLNTGYTTEFLHQFLKKIGADSELVTISTTEKWFEMGKVTPAFLKIITFLSSNLAFQTESPVGKTSVCPNTVTTVKLPFQKGCDYEWFVDGGDIQKQERNQIQVKWNGSREGRVQVIKTNEAGIKGEISPALIVKIERQPVADFEVVYLSGNTVEIQDRSANANLFILDFGHEGESYQGKPRTKAYFSYPESGEYWITQTAEGSCGVATQSVPIEINRGVLAYQGSLDKMLAAVPSVLKKGEILRLKSDAYLKNSISEIKVKVKDNNDKLHGNFVFDLKNSAELTLTTKDWEEGIYFLEFLKGEELLSICKFVLQ